VLTWRILKYWDLGSLLLAVCYEMVWFLGEIFLQSSWYIIFEKKLSWRWSKLYSPCHYCGSTGPVRLCGISALSRIASSRVRWCFGCSRTTASLALALAGDPCGRLAVQLALSVEAPRQTRWPSMCTEATSSAIKEINVKCLYALNKLKGRAHRTECLVTSSFQYSYEECSPWI
jgi:hypothetical protein